MKSYAIIGIFGLALSAAPILAQASGSNPSTASEQQTQAQQPAGQQVDPAAAAEAARGEEVICRRDRATGSLTRVNRVCKTRNEWNNTAANARDNMEDMQRNASGGRACRQDAMGGC